MNVITPLAITDAVLISSTLPEIPPAAYSPGTLYGMSVQAAQALSLGKIAVYESQRPNSLNNALTNTFWWKFIGYVYEVYSAGVTYALGYIVTDTVNHLLYASLAVGNSGQALTNETKWALVGASNRFAMFDNLRDTLTVAQKILTVVLAPNKRIDSIGLLKMNGVKQVVISMTTSYETIYTKTVELPNRSVFSWLSWLYGEVKSKKTVVLSDLPLSSNSAITITFTGDAEISVGACVLGRGIFIGKVEYGAVSDTSNYSTMTRKFDGSVNVLTQRRNAPKTINTLWIPKLILQDVYDLREESAAKPLLWVGIDQVDDAYFRPLVILGFFTNFPISLDHPNDAKASLTIEEI